jgi:integrase
VAQKVTSPTGTLRWLLREYEASPAFTDLRPTTRRDYAHQIKKIEQEFSDFPLAALTDPRTRGVFLAWRDKLGAASRLQADYAVAVLARTLSWGLDRGLVVANPCVRMGRLYQGSRADKIWSDEDERKFLAGAPERLHLPLLMALWLGQRQGDLLRLPWSAYDGTHVRLRQSKTGKRVVIPVGAPLKVALDAAAKVKRGPIILLNADGRPWTSASFKSAWGRASIQVGIVDRTFHDLRGSCATRLAVAGCTVPEIASITGHSLGDVHHILDAHYLHRDPGLAENAIRKLEARTNLQTELQTGPLPAPLGHGKKL